MNTTDRPASRQTCQSYTNGQVLLHNLPYIAMILIGAVLVWIWPGPIWAAGYVIYGLVGAIWIMVFVCPYCRFWGTRSCPCGYGQIAAKLRRKAGCEGFEQRFRRHIPVIVPLWFLPLVPVVLMVWKGSGWLIWIPAGLFVLDAFVILPLVSARCGCKDCPQRQTCPWMHRLGLTREQG